MDTFTSYATILHILWFALLRYISIIWPVKFKSFAAKYAKVRQFFDLCCGIPLEPNGKTTWWEITLHAFLLVPSADQRK